ncbi:MAG: HupE/UreJ family protein [Bacteroidales bacterium]|nr:HupE/UreJ family protein [Bacteroidales bacterium]
MSIFELYLKLGIDHIADIKGYDHILFILSLTIVYQIKFWKKLLILITAFTAGHTLTLVLASLNIIKVSTSWIEFLIPITIFITALVNVLQKSDKFVNSSHRFKYLAALFFGLIHGLGFSNYLRAMISGEDSLVLPLLSFNLGIEIGQIVIVLIALGISLLVVDLFQVKRRDWNLLISGGAMGISLVLALERIPW